jgi:rfaE bifunctional protein kinase chain/domain
MKKVFVSGDFFVLHPGHQRFLSVASSFGDQFFIGINNNRPTAKYKTPLERMEQIKKLNLPNTSVFVIENSLREVLQDIKPDMVVKGSEYQRGFNPEEDWIKDWSGRLLFASGEVSDLAGSNELAQENSWDKLINFNLVRDYIERHRCGKSHLLKVLDEFKKKKVLVIGDLIVDEYISCDALGMSQEDPSIVVSPSTYDTYLGGAGIVASHVAGLGGEVKFISLAGLDKGSIFATNKLREYGVSSDLIADDTRPTTLKQRYRVANKTLLRVNHLRRHEISAEIESKIIEKIKVLIDNLDLLILSDFNYGCLSGDLIEKILNLTSGKTIFIGADSQSSSQIGDVSKFRGVHLITPTEHEARISLRDDQSGLHHLAHSLSLKADCSSILLTLGRNGVLINSKVADTSDLFSDHLPAFNINPVDPAGAGDSMLVASSLAMCSGASIFQAGFLGSLAAAIQVSRVGNVPIDLKELTHAISKNT